jgi:hypothetical protein
LKNAGETKELQQQQQPPPPHQPWHFGHGMFAELDALLNAMDKDTQT